MPIQKADRQRPPHITINSGSGGDILAVEPHSNSSTDSITTRQLLPPQPFASSPHSSGTASPIYGRRQFPESSELLLPRGAPAAYRPYRDVSNATDPYSTHSSRRTSASSDGGRYGPFASPFDDRIGGPDDDNVNTQTVTEKYNCVPTPGLLVFPEDVELDDEMHNPDPDEKEHRDGNIWTRRGAVNLGGLGFLLLGMLSLFIIWPVLTVALRKKNAGHIGCEADPDCLSDSVPLLKNMRTGLIDPDTPESVKTKTSKDGTKLELVFSDEFKKSGRTFYDGDDPYFQAVDIWYGATQDLEWYDPDAVSTDNGTLNLRFDAFQSHFLNYRSGMVQSWNKLCFKGGRLEASISLPGRGDVEGFWPGFWAMGNLGRPGYLSTTDGLWPYSYEDKCDVGITKNQSSTDGLSLLPGMRLPACTCAAEDHPSPGKSRSAPEIDCIEASVDFLDPAATSSYTGTASQSFQLAPFDIWYQPDYNFIELYDQKVTGMNTYRGGPYQEAFSAVTFLNNKWYDGNAYQTYGFEYKPGAKGDLVWFVGDEYTWKIDPRALRANGNIGQRIIPEEPMAMIMNFGMSNSFAQVFLADLAKLMPATMRFDYIRIYQDPNEKSVTCDPVGYPTTDYIKNHPEPYANPNLTLWEKTNYDWPQNTFVDGCKA
ncbi:hypothetical protein VE01_06986 [Pseudogymnoascus verrucosus]|uniref:GH16 domain-containing protein n=1 Tax=Pseudogymnoascus verrucosus TaxID=342668 RepID=A0A1B8GE52_9PEZI|nr:uncharacterized protein VE01_06986 [Pseudogymnoascus verrucosus]OBT94110.1 hypothetical protein VE01_06986 [Pseudogymnoascus verrucosus]